MTGKEEKIRQWLLKHVDLRKQEFAIKELVVSEHLTARELEMYMENEPRSISLNREMWSLALKMLKPNADIEKKDYVEEKITSISFVFDGVRIKTALTFKEYELWQLAK